jgi:hypothetical protein
MKSYLIVLSSLAALTILSVSMGWCHGVEGYVEQIRSHCITAMYDDGEPMSYAAVEIKAPNSEIVFQTGRTDRNGCFVVKTDLPGDWEVVVSDGMGHRLALDFSVSADPEKTQTAGKTTTQGGTHHPMRPEKQPLREEPTTPWTGQSKS